MQSKGFTLIEMLIVITMAAIILGIAIPSFQSIIQNNYSLALSNDLNNSLVFARSEAVRRNAPISLCATANENLDACGSNWNLGWIVFVDPNATGSLGSSTTLLRVQRNTGRSANISTNPSRNVITYLGAGFPDNNSGNVVFSIFATGCTTDHARNITVTLTGKVSTVATNCP